MTLENDRKFVSWLLSYKGMPKMKAEYMGYGRFAMMPSLSNDNELVWPYTFVNSDIHMMKMTFSSLNELIKTLFNTKEIWPVLSLKIINPLFDKSLEELKIQYDLEIN